MRIREAKLLASDFIFLEAPRWKDGAVWAPDVFDSILYRVDMQGKKEVVVRDLPPRPPILGAGGLPRAGSPLRPPGRHFSGRRELSSP